MLPKHDTFLDILNDMFEGVGYFSPQSNNYTFKGQVVDTEKFDIVPKQEYLEKEIMRKQEELKSVEEIHRKNLIKIQQEIDVLKRAFSPINPIKK